MNASDFRRAYMTDESGYPIVPLTVCNILANSEDWRLRMNLKPREIKFLSSPEVLEGMRNIRVFLLSTYRYNTVWKDESLRQYLLDNSEKIYYATIRGTMTPWYPR